MNLHHWIRNGITAFLVFFLTACSESSPPPIRIGINPWPGYAFLVLAEEKGFFREEGVNVDLVELTSLTDVRRAFERGDVDGMCSTLVDVAALGLGPGRKAIVTLVTDFSEGTDVIIARKSIKSVEALKGKKVAVEPNSLNTFLLARALEIKRLSLADVEIKEGQQISMMKRFSDGRVDAVVSYPPFSTRLLERKDAHVIFDSAEIPGEVADVVSFEQKIVETRPEDIQAIKRAWDRAIDYAARYPGESNKIMGFTQRLSAEQFAASLEGLRILRSDEQDFLFRADGPIEQSFKLISSLMPKSDNLATGSPVPELTHPEGKRESHVVP